MNMLLRAAAMWVPTFLKRRRLEELVGTTADAFGRERPCTKGLSYDAALREYALLSAEWARASLDAGTRDDARERLFGGAYRLGESLRRDFGVASVEDVMTAARVVYRAIGIDFRGATTGEITIPRCFFSQHYDRSVCEVISGLDEGLLAGLSGGRRLEFTMRITEGADCCRARMLPEEHIL